MIAFKIGLLHQFFRPLWMKASDSVGLARVVLTNCSQIPLKSICGNNWPVTSLCRPYLTKAVRHFSVGWNSSWNDLNSTRSAFWQGNIWYESSVPDAHVMLILNAWTHAGCYINVEQSPKNPLYSCHFSCIYTRASLVVFNGHAFTFSEVCSVSAERCV